jgi:hypothetical protein
MNSATFITPCTTDSNNFISEWPQVMKDLNKKQINKYPA